MSRKCPYCAGSGKCRRCRGYGKIVGFLGMSNVGHSRELANVQLAMEQAKYFDE